MLLPLVQAIAERSSACTGEKRKALFWADPIFSACRTTPTAARWRVGVLQQPRQLVAGRPEPSPHRLPCSTAWPGREEEPLPPAVPAQPARDLRDVAERDLQVGRQVPEALRVEVTECPPRLAHAYPVRGLSRRQRARAALPCAGAARVSPSPLPLFRAAPHLGRLFLEEEARAGAEPVLLLNHRARTNRFAANPTVVGGTVEVDDESRLVVSRPACPCTAAALRCRCSARRRAELPPGRHPGNPSRRRQHANIQDGAIVRLVERPALRETASSPASVRPERTPRPSRYRHGNRPGFSCSSGDWPGSSLSPARPMRKAPPSMVTPRDIHPSARIAVDRVDAISAFPTCDYR